VEERSRKVGREWEAGGEGGFDVYGVDGFLGEVEVEGKQALSGPSYLADCWN
jgi:hypothetical protein